MAPVLRTSLQGKKTLAFCFVWSSLAICPGVGEVSNVWILEPYYQPKQKITVVQVIFFIPYLSTAAKGTNTTDDVFTTGKGMVSPYQSSRNGL